MVNNSFSVKFYFRKNFRVGLKIIFVPVVIALPFFFDFILRLARLYS